MLLDMEKSGEQDKERCWEWLVNKGPDYQIPMEDIHISW